MLKKRLLLTATMLAVAMSLTACNKGPDTKQSRDTSGAMNPPAGSTSGSAGTGSSSGGMSNSSPSGSSSSSSSGMSPPPSGNKSGTGK